MFNKTIFACLLFIITGAAAQKNEGVFNEPVMPGPRGVFLFITDTAKSGGMPDKNKTFIISKDDNGKGNFKKIAAVTFPADARELAKRLGSSLLTEILQQRNFGSAEDLYRQLSLGRMDTLGLYVMNTDVLAALGLLYFDKTGNKNANTGYKAEAEVNGVTRLLYRKYLRDVAYTPFPEFRRYHVMTSDSVISCTWYAVKGKGVFADITQTGEKSKSIGRQLIYRSRDTLFVSYTASTVPGGHYTLFAKPVDLAGNEGRPSDTVRLIASSMNDAISIDNITLKDTLGGMLLNWNPLPAQPWHAGIRISKSHSAMENYMVTDTLPPDAVSWLDRNVIGGTVYYYQVEPLLYNLPNKPIAVPTLVNGIKNFISEKMIAPQGLQASLTPERNIRLSWTTGNNLNLFGYYVLRGTSPQNLEVISPPVQDTVYIDSLKALDPGSTYLYALVSMDLNMQRSDTTETLTMICPVNEMVTAPAGLSARYAEYGVRLFWNNVAQTDEKVIGYIAYKRKKGDPYFTPLMDHPWDDHTYIDTLIGRPGTFEYGCAAMDARGNQSMLSPLATVDIPGSAYLYPPAGFDLKNSPEGIVVTIPPFIDAQDGRAYIIYKRTAEEKQLKKAGETSVQAPVFTDRNVKKGVLYVYTISLRQHSAESGRSAEKAIRRK